MSLLILEDVKKHYGAQEILSGARLRVDPGQKVGLVGRNGGGKTTLLRLIEGVEAPDWGRVSLRKGADLGYVPQRVQFDAGATVRGHVEGGLDRARRTLEQLERAAEEMSSAEGADLERWMAEHQRLTERVELLGGWEIERRVETVLSGIGLAPDLWEREAATLSGGEKSRTALARALAAGHDLLLLDEPTNHLDLEGIEWIEEYIRSMDGAVLIVSHDRRLLSNAVEVIFELERGELTRYAGNYPTYLRLKEERYESEQRAFEQQQNRLRRERSFVKKHMGSQRTAEAKGRLKRLQNVELLPEPFLDVRQPVIRPPQAARGGELVLETEGLGAAFGERTLFAGVDLRIGRGQRIGVVGRNGIGKTTLLRILAGLHAPTTGKVLRGHGSSCGFYDQETAGLREDGTVLSELRRGGPTMTDLEARSHLALFLFRGETEVEKPVSALSGGERARLALARLVLTQPSWLAMDEPTNHLDLASRTALEEMLGEFSGALLCISHDRTFLDELCDHILEVTPEGVRVIEGNYTRWRSLCETEREAAEAERATGAQRARRKQAASPSGRSKRKPRNPYKIAKLEERIIELEERLASLNEELGLERVYRDAALMKEQQIAIAEVERELAEANEEWESWA
ncbi:MAG: ABC-F family ATP-binding cassette domain-containing protein [Planctomycetota bacterium]|nr:ABC-F family ATP-binding cassette domain-containing protein [Planctomycetota bacterium]